VIRVWSPGCSTGEEAYSLAILLQEHLEALKQSYRAGLRHRHRQPGHRHGRAGIYPASIAADVSPRTAGALLHGRGRRRRLPHPQGIRDMLVFSEQDVIKDPPFSRLDLISCRNLLIYMNAELQKKLMPLFHYALNPGGVLFLGTSEAVGEFAPTCSPYWTAGRSSISARKIFPAANARAMGSRAPPATARDRHPGAPARPAKPPGKRPLRELTEQALLQHVAARPQRWSTARATFSICTAAPGCTWNLRAGEAGVNNILKMAREGLRARPQNGPAQSAVAARSRPLSRICGSEPTATSPRST
jgi:two-component system CheB/CheR fusion protein